MKTKESTERRHTLPFLFTIAAFVYKFALQVCVCDSLLSSLPPSPKRANSAFRCVVRLRSNSRSSNIDHLDQNNPFSATAPFNHDIARTLFSPLFFSLYHYNSNENNPPFTRHRYERPSPFEDPSCARTAERMLRRMMENRHRSDGRTVCPDGRTFGLVAGSFGRLRCGNVGRGRKMATETVTWEDELIINSQHQKVQSTPIDKIQELLQLQLQLCHREGWPLEIRPSVVMYNRLLKRLAWQSGSFKSQLDVNGGASTAEQAWLWLQLMTSPLPPQNHITDHEKKIICRPDATTYAHVIDALSVYRGSVPSKPVTMNQNSVVCNSVVSAYEPIQVLAEKLGVDLIESERRRSNPTSEWFLAEAEALLSALEDEYNELTKEIATDSGWSKIKVKRALAHGYRCLSEGWGRNAVTKVSIESKTSNTEEAVFDDSWEDSPSQIREHSIKRAHELLCKLEALNQSEQYSPSTPQATVVPTSCYSSVILALSVSDLQSTANVAEDVLQRMISHYGIHGKNQTSLSSSLFNVIDVATAFSGCIAAHAMNNDAPKAEKILNKMLDLYDGGKLGPEFVPEVRAFGTCIALWGRYDSATVIRGSSREKQNRRRNKELPSLEQRLQNADRAQTILSKLEVVAENEANKKNDKFVLGIGATPYNIAILARVQTIADKSCSSPKSARFNYDEKEENEQIIIRAQDLLDHMEYERGIMPDPYTYSILLHAWCQQSRPGNEEAADYAEALLRRRIEDVEISKIQGDDDFFTIQRFRERRQGEIWPNVKHFSSVLKAHAKTKSAGGAKKALALLSEMEQRFYDADVLVDADSDDNLTEFHVEQRDVAKPDLVCYSIVIDAFANSRLPEASSVAHRLLRAVEAKYEGGDVSMKPNTRIYTAVILSLVHSPLNKDEKHGDLSGERISNAQKAWSILENMKKNGVPPNSFTYNYVINCCSHDTEDQRSSFELAIRAFQELRKASEVDPDIHPDSFTFAFVIKTCSNLLPPCTLRTKVTSQAFKECCRSGYLNDAVLDRLWRGLPAESFYELVEEKLPTGLSGWEPKNVYQKSPISANNLPASWSIKTRSGRGEELSWKKRVRLDAR